MATFHLSPLADADLDEIWQFISMDSDEMADRFIAELLQKFELLAAHPFAGVKSVELGADSRKFPHKSYLIFYFPTEYGAEIFRILHAARDIQEMFTDQ